MKAKRFYSLFIVLALCLSLFPVSADGGTIEYNLWIGGTQVTSANAGDVLDDGKVRYDPDENILTLDGASITWEVEGSSGQPSGTQCGIYYDGNDDLTVHLTGENHITTTSSEVDNASLYGFYSEAGVKFTGEGSLTVTVGDETERDKNCYGIYVKDKSEIDTETTVEAIAKSAKKISVGYGINGKLTVKGNLTGTGGSAEGTKGIDVEGTMIVENDAFVKAQGGSGKNSYGLSCFSNEDCLVVNGGSVMATGGDLKGSYPDAEAMSCGIAGYGVGRSVINGGSVTATGGEGSGSFDNVNSYGIWCSKIDITGGIVKATRGKARNESSGNQLIALSCGIHSGSNMQIKGTANVTAIGGDAECAHFTGKGSSISTGIRLHEQYDPPTLTISENAVVNTSSGKVENGGSTISKASNAIFAGNVNINGGNVTAKAGETNSSYGISCGGYENQNITIEGGKVTVIAYSRALSKAPVLGDDVTAGASEDIDGINPVIYNPDNNDDYKWFKSPFTALVTHVISLEPTSHTFSELNEGYSEVTAKTVTVRNIGTEATGELSITLEGINADSFTSSVSIISSIEPSKTAEFTVAPKIGLSAGTYSATIKITGENDISAILPVSIKVNPPADTGGTGGSGDTGGSGSSGGSSDGGSSGSSGGSSDSVSSYHSGGTSSSSLVEKKEKAQVSDSKNKEKIDIKIDKKKGTALVELKETSRLSGKDIVVSIPQIKDIVKNILSVKVSRLSKKINEGSITLETDIANIILPSNMLTDVEKITGNRAQISVAKAKKSDLPAPTQEKFGDKPIISLNLSIDKKPFKWDNRKAAVKVSIPYTPTANEMKNLDGITAYYIDNDGNLKEMEDAKYNLKTKELVFSTNHFGYYTIGYKEDNTKEEELQFSDVNPGNWYYDAVKYIASKKITDGTGEGKFSPEAPLTRGEFIVMLMRAYNIEADASNTDNFEDAGESYYTDYLATAKKLGIAKGVGDNKFAPEKVISREQMFTLLYNALKIRNQLPMKESGKVLSDFADASEISSWANEAMSELVKNGVIAGSGGKLQPKQETNRAQMAQVLYNLLSSN